MKTLTIRQPYVQAILSGHKRYETRGWKTNFRGKILIHVGAAKMSKQTKNLAAQYEMDGMAYGAIVLECELVDCILITPEFRAQQSQSELDFGDWTLGRYAWRLQNVKPFKTPIPAQGQLGLWNFDC